MYSPPRSPAASAGRRASAQRGGVAHAHARALRAFSPNPSPGASPTINSRRLSPPPRSPRGQTGAWQQAHHGQPQPPASPAQQLEQLLASLAATKSIEKATPSRIDPRAHRLAVSVDALAPIGGNGAAAAVDGAADAASASASGAVSTAAGGIVAPASATSTHRPASPTEADVAAGAAALRARLGGAVALAHSRTEVASAMPLGSSRADELLEIRARSQLHAQWGQRDGGADGDASFEPELEAQYLPRARAHANPLWSVPRPDSSTGFGSGASASVSGASPALSPSSRAAFASTSSSSFSPRSSLSALFPSETPDVRLLDELQDSQGDGWLVAALAQQKAAFSARLELDPQVSVRLAALQGAFDTRCPDEAFLHGIEAGSARHRGRAYDPLRAASAEVEAEAAAAAAASAAGGALAGKHVHHSRPVTSEGPRSHSRGAMSRGGVGGGSGSSRATTASGPRPPLHHAHARSHSPGHVHAADEEVRAVSDAAASVAAASAAAAVPVTAASPNVASQSARSPSAPGHPRKTSRAKHHAPAPASAALTASTTTARPSSDAELVANVFGSPSPSSNDFGSKGVAMTGEETKEKEEEAKGEEEEEEFSFQGYLAPPAQYPDSSAADVDTEADAAPGPSPPLPPAPKRLRSSLRHKRKGSRMERSTSPAHDDPASGGKQSVSWAKPVPLPPEASLHGGPSAEEVAAAAAKAAAEEKEAQQPPAPMTVEERAAARGFAGPLALSLPPRPPSQARPSTAGDANIRPRSVFKRAGSSSSREEALSARDAASSVASARARSASASRARSRASGASSARSASRPNPGCLELPPAPLGSLSSFGYAERSCSAGGHTALQLQLELRSGSGSSAVPMDVMARPRASASGSGGSGHLISRASGCSVKYRSRRLTGARDVLASKVTDTLVKGSAALLDSAAFRREVALLTDARSGGINNRAMRELLNEASTAGRLTLLRAQSAAARARRLSADDGVGAVGDLALASAASARARVAAAAVALTTPSSKLDAAEGGPGGIGAGEAGVAGPTAGAIALLASGDDAIPARYPQLAGIDVAPIAAPSFGEPSQFPFRCLGVSSGGGARPSTDGTGRPAAFDSSKYLGPGSYHPKDTVLRPHVPLPVCYGPSHSAFVAPEPPRAPLNDATDGGRNGGPGWYAPNHSATGAGGKAVAGLVELRRSSGRGSGMAWRGPWSSAETPGVASYDPAGGGAGQLWSEQLKHRYAEHGFGSGKRFKDAEGGSASGGGGGGASHRAFALHPAKLLSLCSPSDGPGTLHTVIPSRSGISGSNRYDPNVGAYLHAKGIPQLADVARYLSREEMAAGIGTAASGGGGEGAAGAGASGEGDDPRAYGGAGSLTRGDERMARDMELLLSSALATVPVVVERRAFVPVLAPTRAVQEPTGAAAAQGEGGDAESEGGETGADAPSAPAVTVSTDPYAVPPPSLAELRARAVLLGLPLPTQLPVPGSPRSPKGQPLSKRKSAPPGTTTAPAAAANAQQQKQAAEEEKDHAKLNRAAAATAVAGPAARRDRLVAEAERAAQRREATLERGRSLFDARQERLRAKLALAAADDAFGAEIAGGGSNATRFFSQRWLVIAAAARRTAWLGRVLSFTRRMRSPLHQRSQAARLIQRCWRRCHARKVAARRMLAVQTLNRVFGLFRIQLRIRRKQKAATLLRSFFATIAANGYQPPQQFNLRDRDGSAALLTASGGGTASAADVETDLRAQRAHRAKKKAQAQLIAKLKARGRGDRTLVGLIRHFKSQVVLIQRAWRAYLLCRDFQIDMHVLLWDNAVAEHYSQLYARHKSATGAAAAAAAAAASAASAAAALFRSSSLAKPSEHSKAFKAQAVAMKAAQEVRALQQAAEARLRREEALFEGGTARPGSSAPAAGGGSAWPRASHARSDSVLSSSGPVSSGGGAGGGPSSPSTSPRRIAPIAKPLKPAVLKLEGRFSVGEKRSILLDALRHRRLRYLRVKRHYQAQMARWVSDQSTGVSAARRLLESPPDATGSAPTSPRSGSGGGGSSANPAPVSRFSAEFFAAKFARAHPPPYLPRIMTQRQMVLLINAASAAKRDTRKSRYNTAALQARFENDTAGSTPSAHHHGHGHATDDHIADSGVVKQLFAAPPAFVRQMSMARGSASATATATGSNSGSTLRTPSGKGSGGSSPMLASSPQGSVVNLQRMPTALMRTGSGLQMQRRGSLVSLSPGARTPTSSSSNSHTVHGSPRSSRHEGDLTERRLRDALLKAWAAQLPIPTRRLRSSAAIAAADVQRHGLASGYARNASRAIGSAPAPVAGAASPVISSTGGLFHGRHLSTSSTVSLEQLLDEDEMDGPDTAVPLVLEQLVEEEAALPVPPSARRTHRRSDSRSSSRR